MSEVNLDYIFKNAHLYTIGDLKKMLEGEDE